MTDTVAKVLFAIEDEFMFDTVCDWVGDQSMLFMESDTGCGRDCVEVLNKARDLIKLLADVPDKARRDILEAAYRQCVVFYYG